MQCCRLVGKGKFSDSIGTANYCCVVSGGQVEVHSRRQEPQWRNFAGRWTCLPAKQTGRHGQPNGVINVTNPRLGRWLAWGRQDQYLGHSQRSSQQSWTVSSQRLWHLANTWLGRQEHASYYWSSMLVLFLPSQGNGKWNNTPGQM